METEQTLHGRIGFNGIFTQQNAIQQWKWTIHKHIQQYRLLPYKTVSEQSKQERVQKVKYLNKVWKWTKLMNAIRSQGSECPCRNSVYRRIWKIFPGLGIHSSGCWLLLFVQFVKILVKIFWLGSISETLVNITVFQSMFDYCIIWSPCVMLLSVVLAFRTLFPTYLLLWVWAEYCV